MFHKTHIAYAKAVDEAEGLVEAFTNTMGVVDADGDIVDPKAFDDSIRDNLPIPVLSGHDQGRLVGKVIFAEPQHVDGDEYRLYTRMKMNMDTEAGRDAYSNVAGEYVREWSVGFNIPSDDDVTHQRSDTSSGARRIGNLDWVEVSSVIRGSSPSTATVAAKSAETEKRGIASHLTAWVEDAWDASLMRGRIKGGASQLRQAHAWVDENGDPEVRSSYRFLHHQVGRNGKAGPANIRAVTSSLSGLNARRSAIPENDRRAVYNHLARHLREAGRKPSELRSAELPEDSKPYPNFHACRIREPDEFDSFRTSATTADERTIEILYGRDADSGDWAIASYRLPLDEWTEAEARTFCTDHEGILFEPATGEEEESADAPDTAASDTAPAASDTAQRQLLLAQTKLAIRLNRTR